MIKSMPWLLAIFLGLTAAGPALADFTPIDDPQVIGSWVQRFELTNANQFDAIQVTLAYPKSGITLAAGGHIGLDTFSNGAWTRTFVSSNQRQAVASGPDVTKLAFNVYFSTDIADALTFNFGAWNSIDPALRTWGNATARGTASWSGEIWGGNAQSKGLWTVSVPEPSTILLRGSWLVGLAALILKRGKERRSA